MSHSHLIENLKAMKRMTDEGLATAIGVTRQTVLNWRGGGSIHPDAMQKLKRAFNLNERQINDLNQDPEKIYRQSSIALRHTIHASDQDDSEGLRVFTLQSGPSPSGVSHPYFLEISAGPGRDMEKTPEVHFVAEKSERGDISVARISGDSMSPTLKPGQYAVLQTYGPPPVGLEPMEDEGEPVNLNLFRSLVPENSIVAISINNEEVTLKRILYRGTPNEWFMLIRADNREWEDRNVYPRIVGKRDSIRVYAKLIGVAK